MLPLEKAMASPRSSPAPPEPPMLGSDDAAQQGEPEAEAEASAEADAGLEAKASAETRGEAEGRAKTIPEGREGVAEGRADAAKVEADAEANTSVGEVGADMAEVSANAAKVEIDAEVKADDVDADVAEVHGSAAEADDAAEVDAEVDPDAAEVEAEAEAETGCERTPVDLEFSRLRFREFAYQEAAGPHQTLARLHELCRQWLRPESCSKEEILEMLVLEQFLGILPDRVRPWVVAQYPENCKKAASLVEGLSDVLDEPGMLLCSPGGSSSEFSEGVYEQHSDPLLLPELPSLLPAWPALESMLLEQRSVGGEKSGEAGPARAEPEKPQSFSEEPLALVEWDHLNPAEENLQSYRKLLLWGYQLSQPDAVPRLETEEAGLEDLDLPEDSGPGDGGHHESEGDMCEDISGHKVLADRLAEDAPVSPSGDVAQEEEGQPEKVPDDQGEESKLGAMPPLEEQDKDAVGLASLQPGAGTKRPHPEDEDEDEGEGLEGPESASSDAGKELAPQGIGSPVEQAPGPSSASSPAVVEAGASGGQPYPCSECGEVFAWIAHLAEHHSSHSSKKHRACPDC
ncbi:zinc finger and SCAN domain-containing protein 18 isoform X1 [Heterocephalus glaber]|uniref:Zinc finger and SCAN domain-containing protein 18 isoform X1 n=1 Tax=Heterocephalus glaber TaxID=10181 RepID=A0AAX6QJU6_HETGA|nr:zinc finger and SCAN domain-containing protein 18 isoform X1 [Heterocephalus glaber]XP_012921696.1 zinc finger and SCAN domain-containing protein 18 isoform X1 [Heterocephalus glaber]